MPPIAQYVFNGVVTGRALARPDVVLWVLWRLLRFPNFAVSTCLTVGAYVALVLNHAARASIELAWLGALVATGVVALAVDYVAFRPMRDRRPFSLAIASIGVAFVLENVVRFIWGNDFRSFDVPVTRGMSVAGLRIGREQLLILGVAVVLMALAQTFLLRTRLGIAMRATADNPRLAAVKGVPTERVIALATLGGAGLAGGAGAFVTLGLTVQWGMPGLVTLGAVAFFAIGAYTSALLAVGGVSLVFAWPAAVGLATAAGAGLAMVALRLREDYLAIVTLGFGEGLRPFLLNETWLTRGANGVTAIPRPLPARFSGHYDLFYFVLVLVVVALVYSTLERLRRSPFGRVLRAIREDEIVAAVAGKPVFRFKVQAFALGAGIAGLAGILFAHYLAYVEPNMFLPQESLFVWLALILGGSGNNRGALLGSRSEER